VSIRRDRVILTVLIAFGLVLRFWGLRFGLPHDFARPDEEKLITAALGVFQGDPNPHFFLYPTLFIYVMSAAFALLFGIERVAGLAASRSAFIMQSLADPSLLHLTARVLGAAAGTATIPVLYVAVRKIASNRAALVGAALLAVAFLHVRDSHFGVTDVPVTLLTVCAFWAALRCAINGITPSHIAFAGLLSGLAASTKYNAALAVLPAAAVILTRVRRADLLRRGIPLLTLLFGCLGLAFLIGTPYALLDWRAFLNDLIIQGQTAIGQHHGSILDEARKVVAVRGWTHHLTFTLPYGLGLPLLVAAIGGALSLAIEEPGVAVIALSFPAAFYASMGSSLLVYARWMVPMVPFLCMTAGMLVDRAGEIASRMSRRPQAAIACIALLLVVLGTPTLAKSIAFDRLVSRTDTRVLAAQWIENRFPQGATLYQTGAVYGYVEPRPADRYVLLAFDEYHRRFRRLPDLIVVPESPLVIFNGQPPELLAILGANYRWVETFQGSLTGRTAVYEQQDAFYVPFANLDSVRRPGPDVRIYQRK
jgi:dolichyl-phosphate-mannose-protein mannosyltransferase